jgi:hypothetical protein
MNRDRSTEAAPSEDAAMGTRDSARAERSDGQGRDAGRSRPIRSWFPAYAGK